MGLKDFIGVTEDCSDFLQRQMPSVREEEPGADRKDISRNNEAQIELPANISIALISNQ
jgi:hypothetical protein